MCELWVRRTCWALLSELLILHVVFSQWRVCDVSVMMSAWCQWWCQHDDVSVMMTVMMMSAWWWQWWWCQCDDDSDDDVSMMMSAWWCQRGVWTAVDHEEETEQVKSAGFIPEVDTEAQWRLTFHSDCCNKLWANTLFHSVRPKITHMMLNTTSSQTLQHIRIISNIWELHWTSSQMFHHWFCSENSEIRSVMED